jgi:hypothetical protein
MTNRISGRVIEALTNGEVRLNVGADDGVELGMRFALFVPGQGAATVKVTETAARTSVARVFHSFTSKDALTTASGGAVPAGLAGSVLLPGLGFVMGAIIGHAFAASALRRRAANLRQGEVFQLYGEESPAELTRPQG